MKSSTKKLITTLGVTSATALMGIALNSTVADASTQVSATQVQVEAGDTYKSIAESHGLSVASLEQINGREVGGFDIIYPGDLITLSGAETSTDNNTNNVQESVNTPQEQPTQTAQASSSTNAGTFKISYYDPAVLGSNMGYGGVAANLSVFPKGTQLLITLSNGTSFTRVVNDTGDAMVANPSQLDVAMPNSAIPASGIDSATVQVIG